MYYADRVHPEKKSVGRFVTLDSPDWVNIIPITTDGKVVLVEQYRHGNDEITLEFPAGLIETDEEPRIAAERECREETGFEGIGEAENIGWVEPNPAFLGNRCYHFVWFECEKKLSQKFDENELIKLHILDFEKLDELISRGDIRHSLVISALYFLKKRFGATNDQQYEGLRWEK